MFKTFQKYLQTQQGEFPLTPRTSCCLLPLTLLITTPEIITNGVVITAIATTGLVISLGVMLVVRKNLNSTHQIPQPIMLEQTIPKENLEKLERSLLLSLSNLDQDEEFYRELAANSGFSIERIKEEAFLNELKVLNLIYQKNIISSLKEDLTYREYLEREVDFWESLSDCIIRSSPLISTEIIEIFKELAEIRLINLSWLINSKVFQDKIFFPIKTFYSKDARDLMRCHFLAKEISKYCYQVIDVDNNQKNLRQYIWNNYTQEEKKELFKKFTTIAQKQAEKYPELAKDYFRMILNIDSEELIKKREQFKPLASVKGDYTSEKIDYSPDAIKTRLIEKYNSKPKKQGLSWEEESELLRIMIEDVEEDLQKEYTPEELAAIERIQKRLENE